MVNNIESSNLVSKAAANSAKSKNIKKLVKYTKNEPLTQMPDTFTSNVKSGVSSALLWEGLPFAFLLKRNKKLNGAFISKEMKNLDNINKKAFETLKNGEGSIIERIKTFIKKANDSNKNFYNLKSNVKLQSKYANLIEKAKNIEEKLIEKPDSRKLKNSLAKINKKSQTAKAAVEAMKKTGTQAAETAVKKAGKLSKFGNFMKTSGAGVMLAISGIIEGCTEIIPTFKELGVQKGIKQLGKSAVKIAGDTVGFIAGQQAGVAVGTAIGTALFPGVGTAVGAVVGFVGGLLGSWVAGKATKAIVGPSEREIAKEEQENQLAEQIENDNIKLNELKNETVRKLQEEAAYNNGELNEDSLAALKALEDLETENNPFLV